MIDIQIFVEDKLCEAYRSLATKALGSSAPSIHVARATLDELTSFEDLLDLAQRSRSNGCQQVIFALDHEGHDAAQARVKARRRFRRLSNSCAITSRASQPAIRSNSSDWCGWRCALAWKPGCSATLRRSSRLSPAQRITALMSARPKRFPPARRAMESRILCARSAGARGTEDWRG